MLFYLVLCQYHQMKTEIWDKPHIALVTGFRQPKIFLHHLAEADQELEHLGTNMSPFQTVPP